MNNKLTVSDLKLLLEALDMLHADHCDYSENKELEEEIKKLQDKLHRIWGKRKRTFHK